MITEDELSRVLHEIALEAPDHCTAAMTSPVRRRRRRVVSGATASGIVVAVLAASIGLVALLNRAGHDRGRPAAGGTTGTARPEPKLPGMWSTDTTPASTFVPTSAERRRLSEIGRRNAALNGEPHPQLSVAGTTFARLAARHPSWFFTSTTTLTPGAFGIRSRNSRLWVVWIHGDMDGWAAMAELVDASTMRDLSGSLDVDNGYGVLPDVMADLGRVVPLTG